MTVAIALFDRDGTRAMTLDKAVTAARPRGAGQHGDRGVSDFFEDLVIGTRLDLGAHTFTADEIVGFARRYDPQPFHLDDAGAAGTPFGRLAASGWHTVAVWMKLYVGHRQATMAALAARGETPSRPGPSPGFRGLKWRRPVHAGDTIRYASTLTAKHASSTAGWGLVFHHNTGTNQDGATVCEFDGSVFWECRGVPVIAQGAAGLSIAQ